MPIFEYNGKKYNVRDEHIDSFMKDFPDASTIMEREGKKYRVKSADYRTFMSEQQQPEQSALDSTPETPVTPSAEEMPLTEQDKIRFSANIGQMKRRTEQMIDGFNERMETMREYHENAPLGGDRPQRGKCSSTRRAENWRKPTLPLSATDTPARDLPTWRVSDTDRRLICL